MREGENASTGSICILAAQGACSNAEHASLMQTR